MSTGSPTASTSPINQSAYDSFVGSNPAGNGASKPGRFGVTMSVRDSCERTEFHSRGVSGTP
jgi:hypothetical protein